MKKLLPIILILLIIVTSCTKQEKAPEPEVIPEPPAPPTIEERIESADYTVIAGDWVYLFNDGFEFVQDAEAASLYTTSDTLYDATEFSGEDAVYNFASAIVNKRPTALGIDLGDKVGYAVFDGQYFYYKAGDMETYNLDIHSTGVNNDSWDFIVEMKRDGDYGLSLIFAELPYEKGREIGFETSGRLVSVRE